MHSHEPGILMRGLNLKHISIPAREEQVRMLSLSSTPSNFECLEMVGSIPRKWGVSSGRSSCFAILVTGCAFDLALVYFVFHHSMIINRSSKSGRECWLLHVLTKCQVYALAESVVQ